MLTECKPLRSPGSGRPSTSAFPIPAELIGRYFQVALFPSRSAPSVKYNLPASLGDFHGISHYGTPPCAPLFPAHRAGTDSGTLEDGTGVRARASSQDCSHSRAGDRWHRRACGRRSKRGDRQRQDCGHPTWGRRSSDRRHSGSQSARIFPHTRHRRHAQSPLLHRPPKPEQRPQIRTTGAYPADDVLRSPFVSSCRRHHPAHNR